MLAPCTNSMQFSATESSVSYGCAIHLDLIGSVHNYILMKFSSALKEGCDIVNEYCFNRKCRFAKALMYVSCFWRLGMVMEGN